MTEAPADRDVLDLTDAFVSFVFLSAPLPLLSPFNHFQMDHVHYNTKHKRVLWFKLTEYFFGLIFTPALAPPNGTSGTNQFVMEPEQTAASLSDQHQNSDFKYFYLWEDRP